METSWLPQDYGCLPTGYDIQRELVDISVQKAKHAGIAEPATFELRDIFSVDLSDADVIVVYLLPKQLERLIPQFNMLRRGSRIVSHYFAIPGVDPDKVVQVASKEDGEMHKLSLWKTPLIKVEVD